jgi:hypothetical protein
MLSITGKLVAGSFVIGALACLGDCFLPTAAAQDSGEAAILEDQLREVVRYYEQQRKETERLQQQFQRKQRLAKEFESLIAKAEVQRARIQQWEKKRATGLRTHARSDDRKKRLQVATTLSR